MLSEKMIAKLNEQINFEMFSSYMYLQMSSWCAYKSLSGCAMFLSQHADEEMTHMRRLLQYLDETGAFAKLESIAAPPSQFESIAQLFDKIYHHEQQVTKKVNKLVSLAQEEDDFSTQEFLNWYVAEQHQEEYLFKTIIDKIKLIGMEGQGLFFIDQEVAALANGGTEATTLTPAAGGGAAA